MTITFEIFEVEKDLCAHPGSEMPDIGLCNLKQR